jgi:CheY-like chemotaxis protein
MPHVSSKVMIVDDDNTSRQLLRALMAKQYDVISCASGTEALKLLESYHPSLILMDVSMPDLDGYETCRQIRLMGFMIPIIFVTAHQTMEEHLKAYDAGGDYLVTKPVKSQLLLRHAEHLICQSSKLKQLTQEARSLRDMAMTFLSSVGESGILLNFVRKAVAAMSHQELAHQLVDAISEFGVQCSVMLRHADGQTIATSHREPTDLEELILEKMSGMGRLFEFKQQFIVNYAQVSVMVTSCPADTPEKIGRIRDHMTVLAETTEALSENVSMRIQSMARTEQMQVALLGASSSIERLGGNHHQMMLDTRILLQELVDKVESTYSWLNTSDNQEVEISRNMDDSIQRVLSLLITDNKFEAEMANVLASLSMENKANDNALF